MPTSRPAASLFSIRVNAFGSGRRLAASALAGLLSLTTPAVQAQRVTSGSLEAGTFGSSSGLTPFWLRSNQYGIVPLASPTGTLRAGVAVDYDTVALFSRRISLGGGISAVGNTGAQSALLLPEAYVKARFRALELYVGRRREHFGLADSALSTGSYAWSGNALPIPKIQLEIRQFQPLHFTRDFVAVRGSYAHGWMGGRFVQHTLLHQKSLYIRLGKPVSRLKLYGGVNHQVVWGGRSDELVRIGLVKTPQLPATFQDYLSIISGLRASETGVINSAAYTDFDLLNRVGNHLGSVDVAAELTTASHSFYVYRENPYETGALFYGTSLADGLNGFRIRSLKRGALVQQVVFEFLNTANQGGPEFIIDDPQRRGRVNYFNHAQFRDGWAYKGLGIGTPFINPALDASNQPQYGIFTYNNRVQVYHLGIMGNLFARPQAWLTGPVQFQGKLSYSRNAGTYLQPFRPIQNQFSGLVSLLIPVNVLGGLQLNTALAIDRGALYTPTTGFYLGLRKTWQSGGPATSQTTRRM
ncbi:capsule assembly Wzi family protein [Spirosoma luteolum]